MDSKYVQFCNLVRDFTIKEHIIAEFTAAWLPWTRAPSTATVPPKENGRKSASFIPRRNVLNVLRRGGLRQLLCVSYVYSKLTFRNPIYVYTVVTKLF